MLTAFNERVYQLSSIYRIFRIITVVSEPGSCDMAEGTHHVQLAEAMSMLKGETMHLREEQDQQKYMLEAVLQQLNNLAASYEQ